jgi:hypothetical protein
MKSAEAPFHILRFSAFQFVILGYCQTSVKRTGETLDPFSMIYVFPANAYKTGVAGPGLEPGTP